MAISDQIQQRSDLIGTQVITRSSGKKLGVVNQMWVDVDQREVVAFGVRSTLVTGEQQYMLLSEVKQIGDVVLVEDEQALEPVDIYGTTTLINSEVVTETGELLGKVRGFKFDPNNGEIKALVIASLGLPLIPSQMISTYELPVDEILSSGPDRIVVLEGAEER
ncbi:MAG: PRC-barrel domain-containing protein, partial [Cyanobacteria bacterium P01_F01_bin.42]